MSPFSPSASSGELAILSRSLGTSLHSGISIVKALEMSARRARGSMKSTLNEIIDQVKSGHDLASAVESHDTFFPELFCDLLQVGEQTGSLPEVLKALSHHYENNIRLKKDFIARITPSLVQLFVAIVVIAGLIFILGLISSMTGAEFDIFGWGLLGTKGALTWLGLWAMGAAAVFVFYQLMMRSLAGAKALHRTLMAIPVVGRCLQDFAIARFSWAFHLTQNAGMPIDPSLDSSLRATSNGAFIAAADDVIRDVNHGASLTDALNNTGLFPVEFIQTVDVAEVSGTVPEALDRLSPQFEENAHRSMQALTAAMGWAIWTSVAVFIIYIIIKVALWYVAMLNDALQMT